MMCLCVKGEGGGVASIITRNPKIRIRTTCASKLSIVREVYPQLQGLRMCVVEYKTYFSK